LKTEFWSQDKQCIISTHKGNFSKSSSYKIWLQ